MGEEKRIENRIKGYLDSLGAYYVKIHGSAYIPAGTPDLLACVKGRFVGIEVKRSSGGVLSELQKTKLLAINNSGGVAIVARSVQDVQECFKRINLI